MTMQTQLSSSLGPNLTRFRRKRFLTQKQLAAHAGVSKAFIQAIEQGVRDNPSLLTLLKLCQALNISIGELVESPSAADHVEDCALAG